MYPNPRKTDLAVSENAHAEMLLVKVVLQVLSVPILDFTILCHSIYRSTNPRISPSIFLQPLRLMSFLSSGDVHACLMFS